MKSWARAELMDPWAHGLSPGPKKIARGAGTRAQGREKIASKSLFQMKTHVCWRKLFFFYFLRNGSSQPQPPGELMETN